MKAKERVLKSKDVAWILDWSPDDVIALAQKGKVKASKQGRSWRSRAAEVTAYKKRMEKHGAKES